MDQETAQGSVKPRITAADVAAYQRVIAMRMGSKVKMGELTVIFDGVMGDVPVFKVKGKLTYIRLGDPRLLEVKCG